MYMCIHRFNVCRLICPLFSEFSCDFYQAHFHNILICTSHMLKTATRAGVRAVAPRSSAINQGALVFKITRCDSWPAHSCAPMCEARKAKRKNRIPSAWMGLYVPCASKIMCISAIVETCGYSGGSRGGGALPLPIFPFNIALQNTDSGVLKKSFKHFLSTWGGGIPIPPRSALRASNKGETLVYDYSRSPFHHILDPPLGYMTPNTPMTIHRHA